MDPFLATDVPCYRTLIARGLHELRTETGGRSGRDETKRLRARTAVALSTMAVKAARLSVTSGRVARLDAGQRAQRNVGAFVGGVSMGLNGASDALMSPQGPAES